MTTRCTFFINWVAPMSLTVETLACPFLNESLGQVGVTAQ